MITITITYHEAKQPTQLLQHLLAAMGLYQPKIYVVKTETLIMDQINPQVDLEAIKAAYQAAFSNIQQITVTKN
jgi:hypothetical protein